MAFSLYEFPKKTGMTAMIDEEIYNEFKQVCKGMGLTMNHALQIFAARVAKDKQMPFDCSEDPLYLKYVKK